MTQKYIQRTLEKVIKKAATEFQAVILIDPRQSGKTTLLKVLFGDRYGDSPLNRLMFGRRLKMTPGVFWIFTRHR